jgi:hypothetical protein
MSCRRQTRCTIVREIRMCRASVRTLQCVLPSPGRVFSVISRIFCSNSGVNTWPRRFRFRIPVTAAIPSLAKAARNATMVGRDTFNCWPIE